MKKKIDRMDVAQGMVLIAGTIGLINQKWFKTKALAVVSICLASGAITLTVEDIVMSFVEES